MVENLTIDASQFKVLEEFFDDLSSTDQKKIFTAGFRRASKPLIQAAKANVPERTGTLKRSIGSLMLNDEIAILVGAKKGKYKGWHGHLVENGTTERFRKNGGSTGRTTGTRFMERAYNQTEDKVFDSIELEWYKEIDKFIIKTNRRLK